MGSWSFVDRRIERVLQSIGHGAGRPIYAGRIAAASPATGLARTHASEQAALVREALGLDVPASLQASAPPSPGPNPLASSKLDPLASLGLDASAH